MELSLRAAPLEGSIMCCFPQFSKAALRAQWQGSGRSSLLVKATTGGRNQEQGGHSGKRVWRRRRLRKKDMQWEQRQQRLPFLEERVRKIREEGKVLSADVDMLMKQADNRFQFVLDIAAEATEYLVNNPDEFVTTKPILKVISDRMNDAGYERPDAYVEDDKFKDNS